MKVNIIRSNRKTVAIHINDDLTVTVKAPYLTPEYRINQILKEKENWINKHIELIKDRKKQLSDEKEGKLTYEDICELGNKALEYIPQRAAYYAKIIGVTYNRITIRNQKSRWGSCSSKGNLNFNCLLMLTPPKVIDYVVVHELCHLKEMNHSSAFWTEVKDILPDYKESEKWLKSEGSKIMMRMTGMESE